MTSPSAPTKSIPLWALASAGALAIAVFAFAARGGASHVEIAPEPAEHAARGAGHDGAPPSLADASQSVSIEMYSAAWCSACSRAKAWLHEQNIAYHEVDVDHGPGAIAQLRVLNPRSTLPTFDVEGQVLVGFQPQALENAIRGAAND